MTSRSHSGLPFANHVQRLVLPSSATARREELETALPVGVSFLDLLELCISTMHHAAYYSHGAPSYNVLLTLGHVYVFSRRRDAHVLMVSGDQLGVNALGFAEFMLVKRPAELEEVVTEGLAEVLEGVGCESVHQVTGGPGLDGDIWIP